MSAAVLTMGPEPPTPANGPDRFARLTEAMGRYARGDAAAFATVYAVLAPLVRRTLRRFVDPDAADDLAQRTFLRVHRARHQYRPGTPVGPWVLTIARRLAIDESRRAHRRHEVFVDALPEPAAPTGDPIEATEAIDAVRAAVDALPETQRAVIALHKLEERPFAEVAQALDVPEGAARIRAYRAYARLRAALSGFVSA
ncbi:MAG: RNA polymerase sigma factor [Myxococcales bacterium]|nr:RNA polymerase sigma factor [Myxococcales bacterium]